MEILKNLFYGFPDLWGGGVAHSVMILSLVIALGLCLGKLRVKGVSLGLAWILFIGLIFGHFSLNLDEHLLHFLKEFGLILFVYSHRSGGRSGLLRFVQERRQESQPAQHDRCGPEYHYYLSHLLIFGNIHHLYGRYPFGVCNQHSWIGGSPAGIQRPAPHRRPIHRSRLCHRLSYGCARRYPQFHYIKVRATRRQAEGRG